MHIPLPQFSLKDAERLVGLVWNVTVLGAGSFPFAKSIDMQLKALMEQVRSVPEASHLVPREDRYSKLALHIAAELSGMY